MATGDIKSFIIDSVGTFAHVKPELADIVDWDEFGRSVLEQVSKGE